MSHRFRVFTHVVRTLLGTLFVFSGIDGLLSLSAPPELPGSAASLLEAMTATGYLMPLLRTVELGAGAMLVCNRFVPLALTALAPVIVNVAAFHLLLAPIPPLALFLLAAEGYLVWAHRTAFRHLLSTAESSR